MALPINIDDLFNASVVESERIEFKENWNPESILHTICAFANDIDNWGGGYIIVGVKENDGQPIFPPTGLESNQVDSIQKNLTEICYKITPNYSPVTHVTTYQGKIILIIWVPGGDSRPYEAPVSLGQNRSERAYFIRKTSLTVKALNHDKTKLLELAAKIPFDDRVNHHAELNDLKLHLISSFLQDVKSSLFDNVGSIPFQSLCEQMKIARGPIEYVKPLNIGLLLFNERPDNFFPKAKIDIVEYYEEVGDSFNEKEFIGPIHIQLKSALEYIKNNILKRITVKVPNQAETQTFSNYPYAAIEEALANAVFHKGYDVGEPIEVNIRHDCIEILSFPGPIPPVDNTELQKYRIVARYYRNRRIGDFLKELRLTEGRSTGIPKIRKALAENGSPEPVFETNNEKTHFLVILPIHPYFKRTVLQRSDGNSLTLKKVRVLDFCRNPKSKKDIFHELEMPNNTYNSNIIMQPLLEAQLIIRTIPDKPNSGNQKYVTTPKGLDALKYKDDNYKLFA